MSTFPFSQLPADVQTKVCEYDGSRFMTFVKPVYEGFVRFAIANYSEIDSMLAKGWLVVNRNA